VTATAMVAMVVYHNTDYNICKAINKREKHLIHIRQQMDTAVMIAAKESHSALMLISSHQDQSQLSRVQFNSTLLQLLLKLINKSSSFTQVVSLMTQAVEPILIMQLLLLVMETMEVKPTTLSETPGGPIGENKATLELLL